MTSVELQNQKEIQALISTANSSDPDGARSPTCTIVNQDDPTEIAKLLGLDAKVDETNDFDFYMQEVIPSGKPTSLPSFLFDE